MSFVDSGSLASTADRVNHAHLFGEKITKRDAKEATTWIVSRYWQNIPERIRNSAKPDPRWAAVPKSFNLTDADRRRKPKTFTGEPLANAALRMVHNREAARALFVLGGVLGKTAPEALSLCASVRDTADQLEQQRAPLFCCGPCTASVWRLASVEASVASDAALDHLLSALPKHRDQRGGWRRFPYFYTVLALSELDHPKAIAELRYVLPDAMHKRKALKPSDEIAARRIAILDRVLAAAS